MYGTVMTRTLKQLALAVTMALTACVSEADAADRAVQVVAYINQQYGCQKGTEEFLAKLVGTYGENLKLEIVDFGGKGKKRWRDDGMRCMGIRINGTTAVQVMDRAVSLPIRFEMPVGYQWTHAELELAVRQAIQGIAESDRASPAVSVIKVDGAWALKVGEVKVIAGLGQERAEGAIAALKAASEKPVTSESFQTRAENGAVQLLVGEQTLLTVKESDGQKAGKSVKELAGEWLAGIARCYPCLTRPFPGSNRPGRR